MKVLAAFALLCAAGVGASAARNDIVEGNPDSSVKVFIYEDLQSTECSTFRALMDDRILPRYAKRVAFVHRDFPLGRHEWARPAAIAGRWVAEQGLGVGLEFRHELLAEQNGMTLAKLPGWLTDFAMRHHLDARGIVASMTDARLISQVDQDRQGGTARGVTKSPTVFVGGLAFGDFVVFEDLAQAIDDALAK